MRVRISSGISGIISSGISGIISSGMSGIISSGIKAIQLKSCNFYIDANSEQKVLIMFYNTNVRYTVIHVHYISF